MFETSSHGASAIHLAFINDSNFIPSKRRGRFGVITGGENSVKVFSAAKLKPRAQFTTPDAFWAERHAIGSTAGGESNRMSALSEATTILHSQLDLDFWAQRHH